MVEAAAKKIVEIKSKKKLDGICSYRKCDRMLSLIFAYYVSGLRDSLLQLCRDAGYSCSCCLHSVVPKTDEVHVNRDNDQTSVGCSK